MTKPLPEKVQVAIVGGGIVGCATAYHLAQSGWSVALFERKKLTSGTTWHAAGLVSETQAVPVMSALARYGLDLIEHLESETGQNTGFKRNGSITLALTQAMRNNQRCSTCHNFFESLLNVLFTFCVQMTGCLI